MKVLVTGANGFIGQEIVRELNRNKIEVIQLGGTKSKIDNSTEPISGNFYSADISNYENLRQLEHLADIYAVIHSAGLAHQFGKIEKAEFEAVNVNGTENVARLAVKLQAQQFILLGSTAIYGINKVQNSKINRSINIIDENADCQPSTPYAESKLGAERTAIKICEANNIALTILRLAPVIGEGNVGNVARLINTMEKRRFIWIGKGENLKTLIYKTDVARACLSILINKKGNTEIFNLAAEPIKMEDFVMEIAKILHIEPPKIKLPAGIFEMGFNLNAKLFRLRKITEISAVIERWLSDDIYSAKQIAEAYNFYPKYSVQEAIARQIKHQKRKH